MNLIAERKVKIHLNKVYAPATNFYTSTNTTHAMNNMSSPKEEMKPTIEVNENKAKEATNPTMSEHSNKAKEEMNSPMMAHQETTSQDMIKKDMIMKDNMATLPETGETATNTAALGAFSAAFAFILGTLGLKAKKERN